MFMLQFAQSLKVIGNIMVDSTGIVRLGMPGKFNKLYVHIGMYAYS